MSIQPYQKELLQQAEEVGALKFGEFVLKSGRLSPYFFNAGLMSTGAILNTIARAYAETIIATFPPSTTTTPTPALPFDVLFGPAYKGISLAACTALVLSSSSAYNVGFAYDRKEAKDHGEGGRLVGVPVAGQRVLILDDVMTAGTAVRGAVETVRSAGGTVVGVVQLLDREEVGGGVDVDVRVGGSTARSTVQDVEEMLRETVPDARVVSVLKMRDLMVYLEQRGKGEDLEKMRGYRARYGRQDVVGSSLS
ncbi:phosphoribosyltransferase-like protein [Hygrophoropsis aurantiaca]|uniref:Phosphoribosyltransferase-like protein n=1 Tax=Hygrophoropsis aurantiaca TaxID=72124 RepID=A0ACB8AC51_9AGAM|nr:phosphoribosyltransferase-like protein [Hygrophoropsis aurantiaca]